MQNFLLVISANKSDFSVAFGVLINGELSEIFFFSRGLRQGDPLSPYLFLIVQDVLSLNLTNGIANGKWDGIKIKKNCLPLSHLFFADDSIFFCKMQEKSVAFLIQLLADFGIASGQRVNFSKSGVFLSANATQEDVDWICHRLGVKLIDHNAHYLGLLALFGKSKGQSLSFIFERIVGKLKGWKQNTLSQAGREVLIKAVVQAIPTYAMSCFSLPAYFCRKLNSLVRSFWWGGSNDHSKIC